MITYSIPENTFSATASHTKLPFFPLKIHVYGNHFPDQHRISSHSIGLSLFSVVPLCSGYDQSLTVAVDMIRIFKAMELPFA